MAIPCTIDKRRGDPQDCLQRSKQTLWCIHFIAGTGDRPMRIAVHNSHRYWIKISILSQVRWHGQTHLALFFVWFRQQILPAKYLIYPDLQHVARHHLDGYRRVSIWMSTSAVQCIVLIRGTNILVSMSARGKADTRQVSEPQLRWIMQMHMFIVGAQVTHCHLPLNMFFATRFG